MRGVILALARPGAAQAWARPLKVLVVQCKCACGARIFTDEAFAVGKRLEIELFLPDGGSLTCDVRVAWLRKLESDDFAEFEAGLEFLSMDEEQELLLSRCVREIKSEPP